MIRKGSKVVYPKHGAGKVVDIYKETVNGKEKEYLKIKFFNSPTTVSIPKSRAKEMGLREPLSKTNIRKTLKLLGKKIPIKKRTLKNLDGMAKDLLNSGKLEDAIDLINTLKSLARHKEKENKNFSYSYLDRLEIAGDFVKSEIDIVLGKKAAERYEDKM